jgi:hypothetical protein
LHEWCTSLCPQTSQTGKHWMLLVMPKLPYFRIVGQIWNPAQFCKLNVGKGPCKWEDQSTFGIFESHKAML